MYNEVYAQEHTENLFPALMNSLTISSKSTKSVFCLW